MRLRLAICALTLTALAAWHLSPSLAASSPPQAPQTAQVAAWAPPVGSRHSVRIDGLTPAQAARDAGLARFYEWASHLPAPKARPARVTRYVSPESVEAPAEASAPAESVAYDAGSVQQLILDVFGSAGQAALSVARCESGFDPTAVNGQYRGIFQLGNYHRKRAADLGYTWDQMFQAGPNIEVAHSLYVASGGWGPWECRP